MRSMRLEEERITQPRGGVLGRLVERLPNYHRIRPPDISNSDRIDRKRDSHPSTDPNLLICEPIASLCHPEP